MKMWVSRANKTKFLLGLVVVAVAYCNLAAAEVEPLDPEEEAKLVKEKAEAPEETAIKAAAAAPGVVKDADGDSVRIISNENPKDAPFGSGAFIHGFIATLSVIVVSELGDKTFFIACIMAMRHPRSTVFAGAMAALALMHVMSAFFGYAITIIPRVYTFYASSVLFALFGIKMLREGWKMSPNETQEEFDEVQEDIRKREMDGEDDVESLTSSAPSSNSGSRRDSRSASSFSHIFAFVSKIFLQSFTMTFLAEWGDRSQLATIVLAAREDLAAVIIGGILGHSLCTGLAVLGGRIIAQKISVRTVTIVGGVVFILFALTAFVVDPNAA